MTGEEPLISDVIDKVYCLYYEIEHSIDGRIKFLGLISTDNNTILDYRFKTFNSGNKDQPFIKCFTLLYTQTTEKDTETWKKTLKGVLNPKLIIFVKVPSDYRNDMMEYFKKITTNGKINEEVKKDIVELYMCGNGLNYNSGLYDSIKDFINFRKDTKETLYYLLQRIIALEKNMKAVQNKLVANDIKTQIKNNNIKLDHNDDDEDFDTEGNGFANAQNNYFTCSRCGRINPKFFNGDYPTLSEFREQFSKL